MAIRENKQETIICKSTVDEWLTKLERPLEAGNFTKYKITVNKSMSQSTVNLKKLTVWGDIIVTLVQDGENVKIIIYSGTKADNIFTIFHDPN